MIPDDFKTYWRSKRGDARNRTIEWRLSLEECWTLWQPFWQESRQHQSWGYRKWCLARNGDQGPYSLENCTIKTHSENSKERWQTNRNYQAGKGDPSCTDYINQSRPVIVEGKFYSSVGQAGRAYGIHKTTAQNRCLSKNFPEWQYVEES